MSKNPYFSFANLLLLIFIWTLTVEAQREFQNERNIPPRDETYRIGVLSFFHETCTYCPEPAGLDAWLAVGSPTDEILGRSRGYTGGFEARMEAYGGVELVGITSPAGTPVGGSSRSWNTGEVWDYFTELFIEDLNTKKPLDGIHLALHGSMAVAGVARPEAELARIVRNVLGDDVIITVTLDLHACVDKELVDDDAADAVFSVKRFPHYDATLQGQRAADVMIRALQGTYKPTVATRKPGVITPSFFQGTIRYPARDIMERARRWENREEDVYISVNFGFAYADVPDNGASIFVVTNDDQELAEKIADDMNEFYWKHREDFVFKDIYDYEEGVRKAIEAVEAGETPVVIADGCDRTGGAAWITRELIRQGASNFAIGTLTDYNLMAAIEERGLGEGDTTGLVEVGGTTDRFSGDPVVLDDAFIEFYDGSYLVLLFGDNNRIIVTPALLQVTTPEWHERVGVDFDELDIVVHKTRVHFFRGYYETGIAGEEYPGTIIKIEVPGWGPADLTKMNYVNGGQYLYPIDMERDIGGEWDRPYIGDEDMIYETGEGVVVE